MRQKRFKDDDELPKKTLFSDWPDASNVVKEKSESPREANAKSKRTKRKRRKQLFY